MIRLFQGRKRVLFFPKGWANSVTNWILGVHSPSGTIKIVNTANPGENKSASLDVDVEQIARLLNKLDFHKGYAKESDFKTLLEKSIDGSSLVSRDGIVGVSDEWLTQRLDSLHIDVPDNVLTDDDIGVSVCSQGAYESLSDDVQTLADDVDSILADYLTSLDVGVTVAEQDHTHTTADISDWGAATQNFLTDADMSAYALDADLAALEDDVADIADWADAIDADLYDASGKKKWVDLTTNQTINGTKTFSKTIPVTNDNGTSYLYSNALYLKATQGNPWVAFYSGKDETTPKATIQLSNATGSTGYLFINGTNTGITLNAPANKISLSVAPTDDSSTTLKAVPTMGWVNNYFSRKTHNHDGVYADKNHTHSGYASTNHTHTGYASSNHNHAGVYAEAEHQHIAADITDLGTTIDGKITTFSNTVSTTYAEKSVVNAIDQDLSDLCEYVESMDGDIEDLVSWYNTGISGSFTFLTDVQFNGTALQKRTQTVTITNGIVTKIGTASGWTNWHTPTVITWA